MSNLQGFCFLYILLALVFKYFVFGEKVNYIMNDELPYRVQESLLDYSAEIGDRKLTGPVSKIYRKDLDPDYVAYYEFHFGDHYYIFAAGPKTGDHRLVQEGKNPSTTNLLIEEAAKNDNTCYKFFRLSPDGVTICEDRNGKAVATTMDLNTLTAHANITTLTEDVRKDLRDLNEEWEKLAKEVRSSFEWKTTKIYRINQIPGDAVIVSDVLELGDSQSLPTGTSKLSDVEISIHYDKDRNSHRNQKINQQVLCSVLGDICTNSSKKVNVHKILKTKHNLYSIQFKVNDDYEFVAKQLHNKDTDFYFELKIREETIVLKYYTIRLSQKRVQRSISWSGFREHSIPYENYMPDYNQHKCCGECWSGCTPVAWAQIFAYYDIVAHMRRSDSGYSKNIWQGVNGDTGSPRYVAPSYLNSHVKKYVEALRTPLGTFCNNGLGSTYTKSSANLNDWFRRRQRGTGRVIRIFNSDLLRKVVNYVKVGYPVMTNIWWVGSGGKSGHSVVVTKIKERSRSYKSCRTVGWWWWKKRKCQRYNQYEYHWFRRLGWGGSENGWYAASARSAFVALRR